jgi:hypothetical protein
LKNTLIKAWGATGKLSGFPEQELHKLAAEKYSTAKWNFRL